MNLVILSLSLSYIKIFLRKVSTGATRSNTYYELEIKLADLAGLVDTSKMSIVLTETSNLSKTSYSIIEDKDIELKFTPLGFENPNLHFTFGILVSNE